jgi:hypothetical protein
MKLIIAGSRTIHLAPPVMESILVDLCNIRSAEEIVSGAAKGIDTSGEWFADRHGVPIKQFPADWDKHNKAAGHIRNKEMADYADALLLIWDGESRGSKNMKENMTKQGKPVYEVILRKYNVEE